jgi:hypothetical protein
MFQVPTRFQKALKICLSLGVGVVVLCAVSGLVSRPALADTAPPTPNSTTSDPAYAGGNSIFDDYINPFVKLLSALVGVVVAISLVVAGIQYSASGGDPSKVAAAKKRIGNAVLALIMYLFMFAFLQWLIPGGIV